MQSLLNEIPAAFNDAMFDLVDMNGDSIPELLYSSNASHIGHVSIYSIYEGNLIECGTYGEYGTVGFDSAQNTMWSLWEAHGDTFIHLYQMKESEMTEQLSLYDNACRVPHEEEIVYEIMDAYSVSVYEEGVGFYRKISDMIATQASKYEALLLQDIENSTILTISDTETIHRCIGLLGEKQTEELLDLNNYPAKNLEELLEKYETAKIEDPELNKQESKEIVSLVEETMSIWNYSDIRTALENAIRKDLANLEKFRRIATSVRCHETLYSQANDTCFHVYTIACPVDAVVMNGDEIVAEIRNDRYVKSSDDVTAIILQPEDGYAEKVIVVPESYTVQLSGFAKGSMNIERSTVRNGIVTAASAVSDIPVVSDRSFKEQTENDDLTGISYVLNASSEIFRWAKKLTESLQYTLGDVNNDSLVGIDDAQNVLIEYVNTMADNESNFSDQQKLASDVNMNGEISIDDAQLILNYYVLNTLSETTTSWEEVLEK